MTVEDPLAAHLLAQIESNVQLLAAQNYLSQADADAILARLPQHASTESSSRFVAPPASNGVTGAASGHGVAGVTAKASSAMSSLGNKFSKMVTPSKPIVQARALWGYNENNEDPKDLTFRAGDVIEIIEETNADWWMGRFNGREGLVPANYVQKLEAAPATSSTAGPTPGPRPYKPFGAAYHGAAGSSGGNPNVSGLQEKQDSEEKKSKISGLKNTLAHSAVGGAGFGAGAAIGGGLVRAIF